MTYLGRETGGEVISQRDLELLVNARPATIFTQQTLGAGVLIALRRSEQPPEEEPIIPDNIVLGEN